MREKTRTATGTRGARTSGAGVAARSVIRILLAAFRLRSSSGGIHRKFADHVLDCGHADSYRHPGSQWPAAKLRRVAQRRAGVSGCSGIRPCVSARDPGSAGFFVGLIPTSDTFVTDNDQSERCNLCQSRPYASSSRHDAWWNHLPRGVCRHRPPRGRTPSVRFSTPRAPPATKSSA